MIIKNYLNSEMEKINCHDGVGEIENASVYQKQDFESALNFLNYTILPPGTSIGFHRHEKNEEMYIILEGEGLMTVNKEKKRVKKGDTILNKQGWGHSLENDTDQPLRILVFEANFENQETLIQ